MIMDVIWPGLKREIEALFFGDGVQIPSFCALEPTTVRLHFDNEHRFGASAALRLDEAVAGQTLSQSLNHCIQQIKSRLPDPNKFFVIHEN